MCGGCWDSLLQELANLDRKVAEVDLRIGKLAAPHTHLIARLCTLPGIDLITAYTLIAESASKRFSGRPRKGDRYLRRILVQNAWAVAHNKDCALTALFYRIAAHAGMKKAAVAVAHRVLMLAYSIIRDGTTYREAGGDVYDRRNPERTAKRLVRRLQRIGFEVTVAAGPRTPQKPGPLPGRIIDIALACGFLSSTVRT